MLDFATIVTIVLLSAASSLLLAAMLYPTQVLRWLQRKRYQYEVTFSLYMLTPTEKFIFNSFLFLFLSMIVIAASLYLPEHVSTIASRVFYYWAGDETLDSATVQAMPKTSVSHVFHNADPMRGNGAGIMQA